MSEIIKLYLKIVDNPRAAKNYKDIAKYYKNKAMNNESLAFEELLNERFSEEDANTGSNTQQSEDYRKMS